MASFLQWSPILGVLLLTSACAEKVSGKNQKNSSAPPIRVVRVMRLQKGAIERTVTALGTLAVQEQATISVKVPGRVSRVLMDLGTAVKKGDLIAEIEKRDYELRMQQAEAALAQARARVGLPLQGNEDKVEALRMSMVQEALAVMEEARKNRDRLAKLSKQGIISEADLEVVQSAYEVAANKYQDALQEGNNRLAMLAQRRAEFEIARQDLADTGIYAPFDGAIQERKTSPGEYLAAGAAVAIVVKTDPLRLRLEVSEREAGQIRLGLPIRIHVQGGTKVHEAKIDRLSPALNEENRMLIVEADVKNEGGLRAGMFAPCEIVVTDRGEALLAPRSALLSFAGIEKVVVVEKGKAVEKPVATGETKLSEVELISGVKPGDLLVVEPGALRTGDPVQVAQ